MTVAEIVSSDYQPPVENSTPHVNPNRPDQQERQEGVENSTPSSEELEVKPPVDRSPKLSRLARRRLSRELALGEKNQYQLAEEYGISQPAVSGHAKRYADEIEEIKRDITNEFAGLWLASKEARIEAYVNEYDISMDHPHYNHHEWIRSRTDIMKNVAEELGQLPPRATTVVVPVVHQVIGVDNVTESLT